MTYTIVAVDSSSSRVGLATVSHSRSVLAKILARAGRGEDTVLAGSQAFSSRELGSACVALAREGASPARLREECLSHDGTAFRQVVLATAAGELFAYTGGGCVSHSGHIVSKGHGFAAAGNMLESEDVVPAMADAFERSSGALGERLLAALHAAHAAGGDFRGDNAAGLVVVDAGGEINVRVDDHPRAVSELQRIYEQDRRRAVLAECYSWMQDGYPTAVGRELLRRLRSEQQPDLDLMIWGSAIATLISEDEGADSGPVAVLVARLAEHRDTLRARPPA